MHKFDEIKNYSNGCPKLGLLAPFLHNVETFNVFLMCCSMLVHQVIKGWNLQRCWLTV